MRYQFFVVIHEAQESTELMKLGRWREPQYWQYLVVLWLNTLRSQGIPEVINPLGSEERSFYMNI